MSLDKAIEHNKEYRKPYRGGKAIDKFCRNHGGDPACLSDRFLQTAKENEKSKALMKELGLLIKGV